MAAGYGTGPRASRLPRGAIYRGAWGAVPESTRPAKVAGAGEPFANRTILASGLMGQMLFLALHGVDRPFFDIRHGVPLQDVSRERSGTSPVRKKSPACMGMIIVTHDLTCRMSDSRLCSRYYIYHNIT